MPDQNLTKRRPKTQTGKTGEPDLVPACSVGRSLEIFSDIWTFIVIREAFYQTRRFQDFHDRLGIPKATLTKRLSKLVEENIFKKTSYSSKPQRFEYRLTKKGVDLYPIMLAMMNWGNKYLFDTAKPLPIQLTHKTCGNPVLPIIACSHCKQSLDARDVTTRPGPGAGFVTAPKRKRSRRPSASTRPGHGRLCSVAGTLELIGDRWSFLVLREAFFGIRRFDEMRTRLNLATNILSDRLKRLTDAGIFNRQEYQTKPVRYEYRLTDKGRDLYPSLAVMFRWGDTWLDDGKGAPLITTHTLCDHPFYPVVICNACQQELHAWDMSYVET